MSEVKLGRPPKWKNMPTIAIRVPRAHYFELLKIAKKLDDGEKIQDNSDTIENIRASLNRWATTLEAKGNSPRYYHCKTLLEELNRCLEPPKNQD